MTSPAARRECSIADLPEWLAGRVNVQANGCWWWKGPRGGAGRPRTSVNGRTTHVYQVVLESIGVRIPAGAHIHHRCETPRCVNPNHLEVLTVSEHWRAHGRIPPDHQSAKTHCPRGHEYTEANTYRNRGKRYCRACHRAAVRKAKP